MADRVLVIGGTRGTGRLIVERLLPMGYSVRVLARSPERAREALPPDVEIVGGDLTRPETLPPAMMDVAHVISTAGVTRVPAGEDLVRATVYDGVLNILAAMQAAGVPGRFLYMTAVGLTRTSPLSLVLDIMLRNVRKWRRVAEEEIRRSHRDYAILRAGLLTNDPPDQRAIVIRQEEPPLAFQTRISRADVAEVFVAALGTPEARRVTLNVIGGPPPATDAWRTALQSIPPDS